jgi:outer membrane protein assembly factor BamD (BamD/ComL family)/cell division protein FtsB
MKELFAIGVLSFLFVFTAGHYGLWDDLQNRAEIVHNYEYKSLELSKKLRNLEKENNHLKATIQKLQAEKEHLALSKAQKQRRTIASIPKTSVNDLVKYDVYKWSPEKLLGVGEKELHFKNYDKSAQFFNTLLDKFPSHQVVNDKVLFQAGLAAYESGKHFDWSARHFNTLVKKYPKSNLYRGAKLWLALSHFYQGDHDRFMNTVEEFRKKYRNTKEWKVLSRYYEDLAYKYKK